MNDDSYLRRKLGKIRDLFRDLFRRGSKKYGPSERFYDAPDEPRERRRADGERFFAPRVWARRKAMRRIVRESRRRNR